MCVCAYDICLRDGFIGQGKPLHDLQSVSRSETSQAEIACLDLLNILYVELENGLPFRSLRHWLKCCLFSSCSQAPQHGEARSSAFGSFQFMMKKVCKEQASFFSGSNSFISLPRVNELLGGDKEKFNIPEDSSKMTVISVR